MVYVATAVRAAFTYIGLARPSRGHVLLLLKEMMYKPDVFMPYECTLIRCNNMSSRVQPTSDLGRNLRVKLELELQFAKMVT